MLLSSIGGTFIFSVGMKGVRARSSHYYPSAILQVFEYPTHNLILIPLN